jgi:AAA+ ATPase superfamily predicted ATPase
LDVQLTWLALVGGRPFAVEAIDKIARSFRQSWAAEAALAAVLAHDLRDCQSLVDIAAADERLAWFPRAVDLPSLALQRSVNLINEVSQNTDVAARNLGTRGWRVNLRKAQVSLNNLQQTLAQMGPRAAAPLDSIVQDWKKTIEQILEGLSQDQGPAKIENDYIAGNPIPPDKSRVFVGRENLFDSIQSNLDATRKPTLMLHGQRRTGKSSLLLQLPEHLSADYVPICVDLQQTATVDGLNRFLFTLAREAVRQAGGKRNIVLPPVALNDFDRRGTHAFYEWLGLTRKALDNRLLLFALDEFEKIEEAIRRELLDEAVLDVFRHLIQYHSNWLVLLFAGVRTLDEMGRNWHSYFISVKPIHISYLDHDAARRLILLPSATHSIRYDEPAVDAILKATRAQPFLVQAVCFELIQHLNNRDRRLAGPFNRVVVSDALQAIRRAVPTAEPYFQDLWATCNDLERLLLVELAQGQQEWSQIESLVKDRYPKLEEIHQALKQLERRELVEREEGGACCFQVPMLRQWIQDEKSPDAARLARRSSSKTSRGPGQKKSQASEWVEIENFYIFGYPILPDQKQVFVGREDLFAKINENLSATHTPALVLHGQRRTGKTSLLLQLPSRLSDDYVPVFINLQREVLSGGLDHFLYTLANTAIHQADEERGIALPPLERQSLDSKGTNAFYEWLDLTRQKLQERRLLIILDEFETIKSIPDENIQAAVLGTLSHLIQHPLYSPWLVLLFAGVHTLEEMGHNWHSYFISAKPIHVSYLDNEAARRLIQLPSDRYSIRYDEPAVDAILEATHAQPFLVQAVCFELIQHLNSRGRRLVGPFGRVAVSDAREAIRRAVRSVTPYFQNLWATCNELEQLMLVELAYSQGEWIQVDSLVQDSNVKSEKIHQALERLKQRELVERRDSTYCFQVPMMRQWIQEEISLDEVRLASQSLYKAAPQHDQE